MKAFVGLCTAMGVMKLPAKTDYWRRSKWLFKTSFNDVMPRDEYTQTWRYLHTQDNTEEPPAPDRLWKLRWFIDHLYGKFERNYVPPTGHYTVDESMVKFKGRLGFKQYMPAKPTKWGIKIWALCESTTGYCSHFQVYTGKEQGAPEQNLSHRVVDDLLGNYSWERPGLSIYMDNYYTGVPLIRELTQAGVNAVGTVRTNRRELPRRLLPKNLALRKHEFKVAQMNEMTFSVWQDTKPVCVLSNCHSPTEVGRVNRRVVRQQEEVQAPGSLADYQAHMKGVDLLDQMVSYYCMNHRSKKWWRRLFFYLLSVSIYNSYVVARACHPDVARRNWPHFQDYVEDLAMQLIGTYRSGRHAPVPLAPLRPQSVHKLEKDFFQTAKVCHECALRARPGERRGTTTYGCIQCQEPVHLKCLSVHQERHNLS
jgi:hypothetical protein